MKILFVTNGLGPDYLSDVVFHGGKTIFGTDFIETNKMSYMYNDFPNIVNLWGRGFTLYGKIDKDKYNPVSDIKEMILNKYFDKIIYGSVHRTLDYFKEVISVYKKEDVIFIDGEDHANIREDVLGYGVYFKRELHGKKENIYPISFGVPEELILNYVPVKDKKIANMIPVMNSKYIYDDFILNKLENNDIYNTNKLRESDNKLDPNNYIYYNESDYYLDYQKSWYGITHHKNGWDCLRHYEILMNGCIPLFSGLNDCPENIMTTFPKKFLLDFYSKNYEPNESDVLYLLDYTRTNFTTKNILKLIL